MTTTDNSADVPDVGKERCSCGHPSCKTWWLTGIGSFYQGSGFTEEEADRIVNALNRRTESADDALLRRLRPYVANVVEAEGALINKRDLEAIDAHLSRPRPARDEADRLAHLEAEARRFAGFYPAGSDGRNTFVIFADKIACEARALKGQKP